ncbi:MAG: hypothetical protein LKI24_01440 [Acidipropionibacterium sp.]|nr:hypothetical protein [Acidipropionibacterium sp.]
MILVAVLMSLTRTSLIGERGDRAPFLRTLVRSLAVGLVAMEISHFVGQLSF